MISLINWNKKHNLTSIKTVDEIIDVHIIDSLRAVKSIEEKTNRMINPTLVDVGSGNGVPGVIWAIMKKNIKFTLIEKIEKKAVFLRNVVGILNLTKNVEIKRVDISSTSMVQKFDIISSRAFADPVSFLLLTEKLAKKNSSWLLMTTSKKIKLLEDDFLKINNFKINKKIQHSKERIDDRLLLWVSKINGK